MPVRFKYACEVISLMEEEFWLTIMFWFTVSYLIIFAVISYMKHNYEFLYYISVMVICIFIAVVYYKELHLPMTLMAGLTILGVMHVMGGNVYIGQTRLYDFWLIPHWFRYDQLVHTIGTMLATLVAYNLLWPHLQTHAKYRSFNIAIILVLIAMGIGAVNEVVEFGAVVFFNAAKGVGDYMNNAFDMFFNMVGSIIACTVIIRHHKKHHIRQQQIKR